jgi:two-component system, NarL family, response regulator NreC
VKSARAINVPPWGPAGMKRALTPRENEILVLLAEGQSNKSAAEQLGISVRTVEGHRARLMMKLELENFADLVRYALRNLLIKP